MKKITLLFLLAFGSLQAQTITLAESFKQALLNNPDMLSDANDQWVELDPDGDGEILAVDALRVETMSIANSSLTDVTGLSAFANLRWIQFANCNITAIDLSGLSQLYNFIGDGNPLASFTAQDLPSLQSLTLNSTGISTLQISNCPALTDFWTYSCSNLTSIEASGLPQLSFATMTDCPSLVSVNLSNCPILEYAEMSDAMAIETLNLSGSGVTDLGTLREHHALKTLDVSNCTQLATLWIEMSDNMLESINLDNCPALTNLILSDTKLTSIDLSGAPNVNYLMLGGLMTYVDLRPLVNPVYVIAQILPGAVESVDVGPFLTDFGIEQNPMTSLDLSAATRLDGVYISNTPISYLNIKNGSNETNFGLNNFTLQYVCADEAQVAQIQAQVPASVMVSSYCSFTPGGDYNTVSGHLRLDSDFNGCSPGDFAPPYIRIDISDGTTTQSTYTNSGFYKFFPLTGSYTITPVIQNAAYFAVTPEAVTVDFPALNQTATQDFCVIPNAPQPDLEVVLTPTMFGPAGSDISYKLIYRNKGTATMSGNINFIYDDVVSDFVSAVPAAANLQPGLAQFSFTNLLPLETRSINITVNLNGPTDTPPLNAGNIITTTAAIDINEGELTPADNTFTLQQTVVNSYDPNDKTCLEGATLSPEKIGEYLHYNINFENIGSAEAINVVVRDVIDASMFDINSLQLLYASHPVYTRVNGNNVEFIFEGINLPPSSLDPIGGHGNVLFKIKTLNTLQIGDAVTNTANIYFDYNHPVETNQARTAFETLGKTVFTKDSSISLHPNPARHTVQISADNQIKSVELFDVQGRILQRSAHTSAQAALDITNRSQGVYFVRVTTQNGSQVLKLVKS